MLLENCSALNKQIYFHISYKMFLLFYLKFSKNIIILEIKYLLDGFKNCLICNIYLFNAIYNKSFQNSKLLQRKMCCLLGKVRGGIRICFIELYNIYLVHKNVFNCKLTIAQFSKAKQDYLFQMYKTRYKFIQCFMQLICYPLSLWEPSKC